MATIIRVDGTEEELTDTSLPSLQQAIGYSPSAPDSIQPAHIEIHRIDSERYIVMDEDGKPKNLPYNAKATLYWSVRFTDSIAIVGDVVIMTNDEFVNTVEASADNTSDLIRIAIARGW